MKHWKFSDYSFLVTTNRVFLQRTFYSLALLILGANLWNHILIFQIGPNPLLNQDTDPVYLLFMASGIARFIAGWPAPYFDSILIISCFASIILPRQKLFPILFLIFYFIYFVVCNMLSGHHYTNIGVLIMAFPFAFTRESRFVTAFSLCRFFLCFMMFSAACWKIVRGNLWHVDQTNVMLITTYLETLVTNSNSIPMNMVRWLIDHKYTAHTIWIFLILIEGIFLLGFISLNWDKLLLVAYIVFFVGGWIIFDIYNFENLLFMLTLTPALGMITKINQYNRSKVPDNIEPIAVT
jgi:hypothetical protein